MPIGKSRRRLDSTWTARPRLVERRRVKWKRVTSLSYIGEMRSVTMTAKLVRLAVHSGARSETKLTNLSSDPEIALYEVASAMRRKRMV
jgi:hypothetical protein